MGGGRQGVFTVASPKNSTASLKKSPYVMAAATVEIAFAALWRTSAEAKAATTDNGG